jgi:prepilin-type N-terminal cleavage/methylation domain-containing protein
MRNKHKGFSLIELLIVVAIILIIAAIAIPNLLRARITANETSAVGSVRTINTAAVQYSSTYGNGFPANLTVLKGPPPATCNGADLLDTVLTTAPFQKSGYSFAILGGAAVGNPPAACGTPGVVTYTITAAPITTGTTGQRGFCSDESGVIRQDPTGAVPALGGCTAANAALTVVQ